MHNSEIKKRLDQTIENRLRLRWGLSYMLYGFWGWGGDIWGWGGGYLKPLRTLLLQEHLTVLKKADAEPKKGRSKKKAIIELHPWKMVWQNCPVSWKFWFPGVISLTMDCCSTQSKITPCNAALENHFELPNWSLKVVLHRPFLILRPMQNLV